jgi:ABC-type transporter Mla maintaining outer membrane lipid asymmetry ATPase subunit MlaF
MSPILALDNISLSFGDVCLFSAVKFFLQEKQIVTIQTGVLDGGTSLLKLCNSTLEPDSGEVLYAGKASTKLTGHDLFTRVGMQFESEGLLSMYTVLENCKLPLRFHTRLSNLVITNKVLSLADDFAFNDLLDKYPYQLNDVQTRMANLLRLLVIAPKIFLLDEIQSGMSEQMRHNLLEKLVTYIQKNECSMIMTITAGDMDSFADKKYQILNHNLVSY